MKCNLSGIAVMKLQLHIEKYICGILYAQFKIVSVVSLVGRHKYNNTAMHSGTPIPTDTAIAKIVALNVYLSALVLEVKHTYVSGVGPAKFISGILG